jgi:PKHD-type hydroxylase
MLLCIPQLLEPQEVRQLQDMAAQGRFADGRATAGDQVAGVKHNEQLEPTKEQAAQLSAILSRAVQHNETFRFFAWPRRMTPPRISRYLSGMDYGTHLDNPIMVRPNEMPLRTDLSMTLFLSDPESYQGGELSLETPFGPQNLKLPAGDAVVYSTTMRHRVVPVAGGTRLAVVGWIESMVSDERKRSDDSPGDQFRQPIKDVERNLTGVSASQPFGSASRRPAGKRTGSPCETNEPAPSLSVKLA